MAMVNVASCFFRNGRQAECEAWHLRIIADNPENPMGWSRHATYIAMGASDDDPEPLLRALDISATAVGKARTWRAWLRWVLADRCRIAADAKRFDIVEAAMVEILDDWPCKCEIDVPFFEWD